MPSRQRAIEGVLGAALSLLAAFALARSDLPVVLGVLIWGIVSANLAFALARPLPMLLDWRQDALRVHWEDGGDVQRCLEVVTFGPWRVLRLESRPKRPRWARVLLLGLDAETQRRMGRLCERLRARPPSNV